MTLVPGAWAGIAPGARRGVAQQTTLAVLARQQFRRPSWEPVGSGNSGTGAPSQSLPLNNLSANVRRLSSHSDATWNDGGGGGSGGVKSDEGSGGVESDGIAVSTLEARFGAAAVTLFVFVFGGAGLLLYGEKKTERKQVEQQPP
jgi:hypothetical protein